jgi:hypothetical protein
MIGIDLQHRNIYHRPRPEQLRCVVVAVAHHHDNAEPAHNDMPVGNNRSLGIDQEPMPSARCRSCTLFRVTMLSTDISTTAGSALADDAAPVHRRRRRIHRNHRHYGFNCNQRAFACQVPHRHRHALLPTFLPLVSVQEVSESLESLSLGMKNVLEVIEFPGSLSGTDSRGARCGPLRTALATIAASCAT